MLRSPQPGRRSAPRRAFALVVGVFLATTVGFSVDAGTTTKPYTATWVGGNANNQLALSGGTATLGLVITNYASPQTLGSANITPPTGYTLLSGSVSPGTAATSGGTLQLRNLNLAPGASATVTINIRTSCLGDGVYWAWALQVKQANDFSGLPGNDFVLKARTVAPSTAVTTSTCRLRFANQPATAQTGNTIKDGFNSTGNLIKVEIYDPNITGNPVVDSSAAVSLALPAAWNPSGGTLTGGSANAVHGVATFSLSINKAGAYKLQASSTVATNTPLSNLFLIVDDIETCGSVDCTFPITGTGSSSIIDPTTGTSGASFISAVNMSGLTISCDFSPYNYPDSRQPNANFFVYNDGGVGSTKTITITIDKSVVQATSDNGTSKYRVCYGSPKEFTDIFGNPAPADTSAHGPSAFFDTTWYVGLLPNCSDVANVAPCVVSWTGSQGGDRIGTFIAPGGDPTYR